MYRRKFLRRISLLITLKQWVDGLLTSRAYSDLIKALVEYRERGQKIATALSLVQQPLSKSDADWINKIENERVRLLGCNELLIDGTLGEGGIYDKDVTIQMACKVSKPPHPAKLLYHLVRAIEPFQVLELGTNVGISGAFLASALVENGEGGELITCDSSPYRQRLAGEVHAHLGLKNVTYRTGLFTDTLTSTLANMERLDLAFIDGHHQYQPTLDYFGKIYEKAEPGSVFVFDDIRWSDGMFQAWKELQRDSRLGVVIDLDTVGIGIGRVSDEPRFISKRIRIF